MPKSGEYDESRVSQLLEPHGACSRRARLEDTRSEAGRAQDDAWASFVGEVQAGAHSAFPEQLDAWHRIFAGRAALDGPPRAWTPPPRDADTSNLRRWLTEERLTHYTQLYDRSIRDRACFWGDVAERLGIVFEEPATIALQPSQDARHAEWFVGASMNIVDSCFGAPAERPAVVSRREGTDELRVTSYGALDQLVSRVAAGFVSAGFVPGDRIALCMPLTVECVAAYLGIVRAGCCAVSIADSFSAEEVASRLTISEARCIVTVDVAHWAGKVLPMYEKVRRARAPTAIVITANGEPRDGETGLELRDGDMLWEDFLAAGAQNLGSDGRFASVTGDPAREMTILFSSGTTGTSKAIPWSHVTPLKGVLDGYAHQDIRENDVVAWPTNIGWMMGPWLIFAGLVNGATLALFEGAPTGTDFTRFVTDARVSILGVVPSLVRSWRTRGAMDGHRWADVRVFSSTGEPSNADDALWLMSRTDYRAPIIEYLGGTELAGGYLAGTVIHPASPSAFAVPALGSDFVLRKEDGSEPQVGEAGELFLVPPTVGFSQYLLNDDHDEIYYAGTPRGPEGAPLRRHGDRVVRLGQGFYHADGRVDDTMNLGGIKISSLELERVLRGLEAVSDCGAIGVSPPEGGGERLVVFVTAARDVNRDQITAEMNAALAAHVNPLFRVHDVVVVEELPRTASNKLMRRTLREWYRR